jgi:hypothetical protein
MHTVGIDNGLDGAWALLEDGQIRELVLMPVRKTGRGSKREADAPAIGELIRRWTALDAVFGLEEASKHSPGKMALCSTWYTYGVIRGLLEDNRARHEIVRPQTWQKTFWATPKLPKGQKFDTKAAALLAANRIWPGQDWRATARCSTPHDGKIDAALLGLFLKRKWKD